MNSMTYKITLPLPQGWDCTLDSFEDETGAEITHLEAYLPNPAKETDDGLVDIYVGPMPEDTTAADQAFANYADMIGFDEDDPEDADPIYEWPFNGRKAYGFEAYCEDGSPMRMMSIEIKKGVLCIINTVAKDDDSLVDLIKYVERKLRIGV